MRGNESRLDHMKKEKGRHARLGMEV